MQLTSSRLQSGFVPVLHVLVARALLNTSAWRVQVDSNWAVADDATTVELWLQSPSSPTQRTAAELRSALVDRLRRYAPKVALSTEEKAREGVTRSHVRAADFVDATFGAVTCPGSSLPPPPPPPYPPPYPPNQAPTPPPPSPAPASPISSQPLPSSASPEVDAVFLVIVEMFDNFGDGWGGGLRLVVRTLGGGRSLSRSLSLSGGALEHSLSLPDGMSSARESFGLTVGCYQLQMYEDGEPLTSTRTRTIDAAEASWRLRSCPSGTLSSVYLAGETARICITTVEGAAESSWAAAARAGVSQ